MVCSALLALLRQARGTAVADGVRDMVERRQVDMGLMRTKRISGGAGANTRGKWQ